VIKEDKHMGQLHLCVSASDALPAPNNYMIEFSGREVGIFLCSFPCIR